MRRLSQSDLQSALNTRLAYVISGDPDVDAESKSGLTTLSQVLAQRTSLIPGTPVGVDPGARRTRLLSDALLADRRRTAAAIGRRRLPRSPLI